MPYGAEQLTAPPRLSGTPSSLWGFVFSETHQLITTAACSWCAAFAAFGYKISGPTPGLWPWSCLRSQQHIRGHTFIWCVSSEPSATSSSSRCWGVCISRWHNLCQKIPRQLHSTWIQWEITVLCQPPQIISSQFPHSCLHRSVITQNLFNACQIQRIKSQCCISTKPSNSSLQYKIIYIHKAEFTC